MPAPAIHSPTVLQANTDSATTPSAYAPAIRSAGYADHWMGELGRTSHTVAAEKKRGRETRLPSKI